MTNQVDAIVKTILTHLKTTNQLGLVGSVVDTLRASSAYKNSQNRVVVTSAQKLELTQLKQIDLYLKKSLSGPYALIQNQDLSLIAGFTLQVNDLFIDASVLGKINSVHNKLTAKE